MHDSSTKRGSKRASLTALAAVVLGCILLQGTPTAWSTLLLILGCVMAFSVGWTAKADSASREQGSKSESLRLVVDEGSTGDNVSKAKAAMERAEASERAMQTTLTDLDRVIESVEGLCATIDGELEGQSDEDVAPLRKGA